MSRVSFSGLLVAMIKEAEKRVKAEPDLRLDSLIKHLLTHPNFESTLLKFPLNTRTWLIRDCMIVLRKLFWLIKRGKMSVTFQEMNAFQSRLSALLLLLDKYEFELKGLLKNTDDSDLEWAKQIHDNPIAAFVSSNVTCDALSSSAAPINTTVSNRTPPIINNDTLSSAAAHITTNVSNPTAPVLVGANPILTITHNNSDNNNSSAAEQSRLCKGMLDCKLDKKIISEIKNGFIEKYINYGSAEKSVNDDQMALLLNCLKMGQSSQKSKGMVILANSQAEDEDSVDGIMMRTLRRNKDLAFGSPSWRIQFSDACVKSNNYCSVVVKSETKKNHQTITKWKFSNQYFLDFFLFFGQLFFRTAVNKVFQQ